MLVIFEGIDGVGKSTQISLLKDVYKDCILTKEPGGSLLGKKLREILLNGEEISKIAEMFLFLADRAEHYDKIISKNKDKMIFCDRSFVSGISYALANSSEFDINTLLMLNKIALKNDTKAKFIFFEIEKNELKKRLENRKENDKIEQRGLEYLLKVQDNMKEIFKSGEYEVLILNANEKIEEIHSKIKEFIND